MKRKYVPANVAVRTLGRCHDCGFGSPFKNFLIENLCIDWGQTSNATLHVISMVVRFIMVPCKKKDLEYSKIDDRGANSYSDPLPKETRLSRRDK